MPAHKAHSGEGDRTFVVALARVQDVSCASRVGDNLLENKAISLRTGLPTPTVSRLLAMVRSIEGVLDGATRQLDENRPNSTILRGETLANPSRETV
jgi:hypothetical protein